MHIIHFESCFFYISIYFLINIKQKFTLSMSFVLKSKSKKLIQRLFKIKVRLPIHVLCNVIQGSSGIYIAFFNQKNAEQSPRTIFYERKLWLNKEELVFIIAQNRYQISLPCIDQIIPDKCSKPDPTLCTFWKRPILTSFIKSVMLE